MSLGMPAVMGSQSARRYGWIARLLLFARFIVSMSTNVYYRQTERRELGPAVDLSATQRSYTTD
jgi:hypothetical protein